MKRVWATALLIACSTSTASAEVTFSGKPSTRKTDGGIRIAFAVSQATDVEVAVLDGAGTVVRHLAAGMLGAANPPPEPLRPGLAQDLLWDGADDRGRPAGQGPHRVRVRAGLGVAFDGVLGEARHFVAEFAGLATDAKGNVYVYGSPVGNRGPEGFRSLQVFDRRGAYLRTLMPMPANLPKEKVEAFKVVAVPGDGLYPRNRWGTWPVLYPDLFNEHTMAARVGQDGIVCLCDGKRLARIGPDGGAVDETFAREFWPAAVRPTRPMDLYHMAYPGFLARSPDGRDVYLSGVYQTKPVGKDPIRFPPGRVYRMKAAGGQMERFADVAGPAEKAADLAGIAFDRDGNLLVCERSAGRIAVLNPEGKEIGSLPVEAPQEVACHRTTGAVYVLTARKPGYFRAEKGLVKFTGWGTGSERAASLALRPQGSRAVLALDDSADPPVVWLGVDRSKTESAWHIDQGAVLLRLEDRGGQFVETDHGIRLAPEGVGVPTRLAVHPENDLVICRGEYAAAAGYEGLTGTPVKLPFSHSTDMAVGLDGNWYVQTEHSWNGPICRYDKDLRPIAVAGRGADEAGKAPPNAVGRVFGRWGQGFGTAGLAVDAAGRVLSLQQIDEQTISGDCVVVFGPDGRPENPGRMRDDPRIRKHGVFPSVLFGPIAAKCGGIGVDFGGHFYVGLQERPMNDRAPAGFENDAAYDAVVGSVVKVKPEGGSVIDLGGAQARPPRPAVPVPPEMAGLTLTRRNAFPCGPVFVENAVRAYPGLGSVSGNCGTGCRCRQPMFQVDGWGRLFIPNAITYSVQVVDNEGNQIARFGHYGNTDSAGPTSAIPTPAIPLGWPEAVGVSEKAIYVADVLNRRIVRLRATHAAEAVCDVTEGR